MNISFCPSAIVWGDVATWFTGIATFLAVCAALWIARRSDRLAAAERLDIGKVFAPAVAREVRLIRYHCGQITIASNLTHLSYQQRWSAYRDHLNALSAETLKLVAERSIYRGDAGRALVELYGEMLRAMSEREQLGREVNVATGEAFYVFSGHRMASIATMLVELSEAALTSIWTMLPERAQPVPNLDDPYG